MSQTISFVPSVQNVPSFKNQSCVDDRFAQASEFLDFLARGHISDPPQAQGLLFSKLGNIRKVSALGLLSFGWLV